LGADGFAAGDALAVSGGLTVGGALEYGGGGGLEYGGGLEALLYTGLYPILGSGLPGLESRCCWGGGS
jgi:hypothetical protein